MAYLFDGFQKFGKEQFDAMTTSSSSLAKSWQTIAANRASIRKNRSRMVLPTSRSCAPLSHSRTSFRFSPNMQSHFTTASSIM